MLMTKSLSLGITLIRKSAMDGLIWPRFKHMQFPSQKT